MTLTDIAEHAHEVVRAINPSLLPYAELSEHVTTPMIERVRKYLTTIPRKPSGPELDDAIFDAVCERLGKYL